jgi:hypothetical protein
MSVLSCTGTLAVTATVVSSVIVVMAPEGVPKIVIANSLDVPETFVQFETRQSSRERPQKDRAEHGKKDIQK